MKHVYEFWKIRFAQSEQLGSFSTFEKAKSAGNDYISKFEEFDRFEFIKSSDSVWCWEDQVDDEVDFYIIKREIDKRYWQ